MTDKKDLSASSPASTRAMIDSFLDQTKRVPAVSNTMARLIFVLDATMSRQPTWDLACRVQSEMFAVAAASAGWTFSWSTFAASTSAGPRAGVVEPRALTDLMIKIDCRGGQTQIGRVLAACALARSRRFPVRVMVYVGDAMEEPSTTFAARAGELGLLGVKAFMFHEGRDPPPRRRSRRSRGSPAAPMRASIRRAPNALRDLLQAAAAYAAGGVEGIAQLAQRQPSGARPPHVHERAFQMTLLYGVAAVAILWWLSNKFTQANAAALAKAIRRSAASWRSAPAALLLSRGRIDMAVPLGGVGAWLLGWSGFACPAGRQRTRATPGAHSRVRSAMIEMELDHDTGAMDGQVLAGAVGGRSLGALDEAGSACSSAATAAAGDPDGVRLLEAYLDRRFPGWRENAQDDMARAGVGRAPRGRYDRTGGLRDPGPSAGRGPRRDPTGAPRAHEETPSRPGGLDVSRRPGKPGQGDPVEPASLILHAR